MRLFILDQLQTLNHLCQRCCLLGIFPIINIRESENFFGSILFTSSPPPPTLVGQYYLHPQAYVISTYTVTL